MGYRVTVYFYADTDDPAIARVWAMDAAEVGMMESGGSIEAYQVGKIRAIKPGEIERIEAESEEP